MAKEEKCPRCGSIFIQYDTIMKECYCLVRKCGHRWSYEIKDKWNIKNKYLRASI